MNFTQKQHIFNHLQLRLSIGATNVGSSNKSGWPIVAYFVANCVSRNGGAIEQSWNSCIGVELNDAKPM